MKREANNATIPHRKTGQYHCIENSAFFFHFEIHENFGYIKESEAIDKVMTLAFLYHRFNYKYFFFYFSDLKKNYITKKGAERFYIYFINALTKINC